MEAKMHVELNNTDDLQGPIHFDPKTISFIYRYDNEGTFHACIDGHTFTLVYNEKLYNKMATYLTPDK